MLSGVPTYTDGININEKGFDYIKHFPNIFSKSSTAGVLNFEKDASREEYIYRINMNPFHL